MSAGLFDEVIHAPLRFRICAILDQAGEVAFATIRDALEISDAQCSKHLKVLADAGYVTQRREKAAGVSGRGTVWVKLTKQGRKAFRDHLAALRAIAENPFSA